jgi:hypothetical protein
MARLMLEERGHLQKFGMLSSRIACAARRKAAGEPEQRWDALAWKDGAQFWKEIVRACEYSQSNGGLMPSVETLDAVPPVLRALARMERLNGDNWISFVTSVQTVFGEQQPARSLLAQAAEFFDLLTDVFIQALELPRLPEGPQQKAVHAG